MLSNITYFQDVKSKKVSQKIAYGIPDFDPTKKPYASARITKYKYIINEEY